MSSPSNTESGSNNSPPTNSLLDRAKRRSGSNPPTPSGSPTLSRLQSENVSTPVVNIGGSQSATNSPKLPITGPSGTSGGNNANLEGIYRKFVKLKKNPSGNPSFLNLKGDSDDNILLPMRMSWSDFESEYEKEYENVPLQLKFPVDEIIVKRKEKIPRTIFSPTIGLVQGSLDRYVRDLIDNFYRDYLIVEHKSNIINGTSEISGGGSVQRKYSSNHKSVNYGSSGNLDLSISQDDDQISNAVIKTKLFHQGKQLTRGSSLGNLLHGSGDSNSTVPTKPQSSNSDILKEFIPERFGLELLCEVKELKFSMEVEPFFCSLYIIDLESKERITECFNFHLNTKQIIDSLKMNDNLLGIVGNQKQCIFSLNKYHPNMYFLLRIYHIFRGDIEKDIKPYFKVGNKQSIFTQFKSEITEKCIGEQNQILQPFVWGVYPVFHRPTLMSTGSSMNLVPNNLSTALANSTIGTSTSLPSSTNSSPTSTPSNSLHNSSNPVPTTTTTPPPPVTIASPTVTSVTPTNPVLISPTLSSANSTTPSTVPPPPPPPPLPLSPNSTLSSNFTSRRRSSFLSSTTVSSNQLVNNGGSLLSNKITNNIEIGNMIPATPNLSDKSICELILSDKDLKKLKPIPGSFVMSIKTITDSDAEEMKGKVTPSIVPLIPITQESPPNFIREIQDFSESPYPYLEYVNNLYIYPENVYIKYKNPNIQIQVQLFEDLGTMKHLKCIYPNTPPTIPTAIWDTLNQPAPGKSPSTSIPYPPLEFQAFSAVNFHDKRPHFTEEFKIKLPTKITPQHYLSFTFYHINLNDKKDIKRAIGHCAVPLLGANSCLTDDFYTFSIEPEPNIESIKLNSDEQKKEKQPVFTFKSKLISSVITQNSNLDLFFKHINNVDQHNSVGRTLEAVKAIQKIDRISCVQFFPAILNQLFQIMCSSANEVASQAFASILHVIKLVDGFQDKKLVNSEKSRLLTFYSEYLFDYVPDSKHLYEELCRQWVNSSSTVKDFRLNWFLFDIMTKSMALSLQPTGKLDTDLGRENRFKIEFQENLNKLVLKLIPSQQQTTDQLSLQTWEFFTTKFPQFICNLFPLIDRGFLYNLIFTFLARFTPTNDDVSMVTVKFNFLKIITDYDHYIPLNFPVIYKNVDLISELTIKFFKRHFLIGLLINEVESCISQTKAIRNQAISTLKQLLKKHHYDPRYQTTELRERISTMYFPFVLKMIDHYAILKFQLDPKESQEWLTCFIWILQYCSKELLINWYLKETQSHQETFLKILSTLLELFKSEPSIYEITLLCIELSRIFLNHLSEESIQNHSNGVLLDSIIHLLQACSQNSGVEMTKLIQAIIKDYLIPKYPQSLFHSLNNSYCEIISHELLKSISIPELIEESSSLFYLLLQSNFSSTNDITKMKIQSTVAISRLVVEIKLENSSNLTIFLEKVISKCKSGSNQQSFIDQVEEMIKKINTIIKYSNTIYANKNDPEMVAEMYYKISNSYFESPNLRLTWLENLSKIHIENEQYDEASQCLVHCAHLISKYLVHSGKIMDTLDSDFQSICPNLKQELGLPEFDQKDQGALFQTQIWTLEYVVQLLEQAIVLLEKCNRYELAIETYYLVSKILKAKKDYRALINCLSNSKQLCETLIEKSKDSRIFSRYYRVGFYGKKLEEQDGKEYIYKKPHSVSVSAVQSKITQNLQEKFGEHQQIHMLSNVKLEETTLQEDAIYIQIVNVEPYIDNGNVDIGVSQFDQYFNLTSFISEVAFSQEGKAIQQDIAKQQKKKTIFSVNMAFPYVKNRLEIKDKKEIILSPIENAIELIKGRCIKLKEQLDTNPPKINPLQQIIQGSVFPMVNEGPLKVCEIFLNKKTISSYNAEHVEQLKKAMEKFLIYCGFTIRLSRSCMTHKHQDFQNMVEKQYETLKGQINSYIK
ncbi:DOCK family protein [Tieghemostelium lacteum]|uniref:DOCK family protein n=1 Tax=Tieghemostelium lacteum TaxID=361077 RepID=A0A152A378_TIELA|nr:DOCK family protein [Tieghemostelium lacteum]|eukprot:KYR00713.1 DOCK family protein [Tieghemostelium lacteum]